MILLSVSYVKMFTAIMMIVGTGIIGICYALINDFVLGSRLKQFWNATRIPTKNHYILFGLRNGSRKKKKFLIFV